MKKIYKYALLIAFATSLQFIKAENENNQHVASSAHISQQHIREFADKLAKEIIEVLLDKSITETKKYNDISSIVDTHFDKTYIQNKAISDVIKISKIKDNVALVDELKQLVINYLISQYIRLTSDYKNATYKIKKIYETNGIINVIYTVYSNRKEFEIKIFMIRNGDALKVQNMMIGSVDLVSQHAFKRLYMQDSSMDIHVFKNKLESLAIKK